jgi:hypothetical protein
MEPLRPEAKLYTLPKCKVKVKLSLCFNRAPRYEGVLGEWRHISTHSLTSALDGGGLSALPAGKEPLVPIG